MTGLEIIQWGLLVPVIGGSVYAILRMWAVFRFADARENLAHGPKPSADADAPPVTVLKPVRGLEKNLQRNLRSVCLQDYPSYQVIYSVQDPNDPALAVLKELQAEFGAERVTVVVSDVQAGANGKVNNLLGALSEARHDILVMSDSDALVGPDYIATMVAPLADPQVGCVFTPFRIVEAQTWFEKMELLSMNADFIPDVIFADVTGAANACLGPSIALRRSALEAIGGLQSLADFLVEDYELGRRFWTSGRKVKLMPYLIDVVVDLTRWQQWWGHQVYWDQNTRFARPGAFFATLLIRSIPFAVLYWLARGADTIGLSVLLGAVAIRLVTAAVSLRRGLQDDEGLRSLAWLPLRDVVTLVSWVQAFAKRTVVWRGVAYRLVGGGRMVPLDERWPRASVERVQGRF